MNAPIVIKKSSDAPTAPAAEKSGADAEPKQPAVKPTADVDDTPEAAAAAKKPAAKKAGKSDIDAFLGVGDPTPAQKPTPTKKPAAAAPIPAAKKETADTPKPLAAKGEQTTQPPAEKPAPATTTADKKPDAVPSAPAKPLVVKAAAAEKADAPAGQKPNGDAPADAAPKPLAVKKESDAKPPASSALKPPAPAANKDAPTKEASTVAMPSSPAPAPVAPRRVNDTFAGNFIGLPALAKIWQERAKNVEIVVDSQLPKITVTDKAGKVTSYWFLKFSRFQSADLRAAVAVAPHAVCIILGVQNNFPFLDTVRQRAHAAAPNARFVETAYPTVAHLCEADAKDAESVRNILRQPVGDSPADATAEAASETKNAGGDVDKLHEDVKDVFTD